jgi:uncharacterized membrane protein YhaH (DUF805 family)
MSWLNTRWPRKIFNLTLIGVFSVLFLFVEVMNYLGKSGVGEIPILSVFVFVLGVGQLVFLVFISILRLHDLNLSGWWSLIGFIPYINLLFLVLLMIYPSAKGPYRFSNDDVKSN